MHRTALMLTAAMILVASHSQASTLATLISSNGTITVGDLVFSDFSFGGEVSNRGDVVSPTSASGITVQGTTLGGNDGLLFTGPFTASGLGPLGVPNAAAYDIEFEVAVQNSSSDLTDIHQSISGTFSPTASATLFSFARDPVDTIVNIGDASSPLSNTNTSADDSGTLGFLSSVQNHTLVTADIDFSSGGASGSVNIPNFTVALSQSGSAGGPVSGTPEPSSVWVVGAGWLTVAAVRARMKRSAS